MSFPRAAYRLRPSTYALYCWLRQHQYQRNTLNSVKEAYNVRPATIMSQLHILRGNGLVRLVDADLGDVLIEVIDDD